MKPDEIRTLADILCNPNAGEDYQKGGEVLHICADIVEAAGALLTGTGQGRAGLANALTKLTAVQS